MVFYKSLTRELTFTAAGIFVVLLAVLVTTQAINLLGQAAEGHVSSDAVAILIGFWSLGLVPLVLILTVFISVLVVLTRLWRDHEMAVWLSSGIGLRNWVWPLLRFALPLAAIIAILSLFVSPWAQQRSKEYAEQIKQREEVSAISPGVFKEARAADRVYFAESYAPLSGAAKQLFVQDISNGKVSTVLAESGKVSTNNYGDRVLILENGRRYVGEPGRGDFELAEFKQYIVTLGDGPSLLGKVATNTQSRPTAALLLSNRPEDKAELVWRLSLPLSCIMLALLALPLSYYNPRSAHSYNMIFALLGFLLYQNGLTLVRNWIDADKAPMYSIIFVHLLVLGIAWFLTSLRNRPAAPWWRLVASIFKKA